MPHYMKGARARIGDLVIGKTYNRPGFVLGVLSTITEAETCNCQVQAIMRGVAPQDSPQSVTWFPASDSDYGEVRAFEPVELPFPAGGGV